MEGKVKRTVWGDLETSFMLGIIKNKKILSMLDGKRYRNGDIYKIVEEELKKRGFLKTSAQIRTKWKLLKCGYYRTLRYNATSGANRKECPFYNELQELLSGRSVATIGDQNGVDSLNIPKEFEDDVSTIMIEEDESIQIIAELEADENEINSITSPENILLQSSSISGPVESTPKTRKTEDNSTYSSALTNFATEWKSVQEELQNTYLEKQKEIFEEETKKQREWELKIIKEEQEANKELMSNIMNSFFVNLQSIMPPRFHINPFGQYQANCPSTSQITPPTRGVSSSIFPMMVVEEKEQETKKN